ncbi:MAG: Ig-like domain-containing protein [Chitinophagaceae bacterium]
MNQKLYFSTQPVLPFAGKLLAPCFILLFLLLQQVLNAQPANAPYNLKSPWVNTNVATGYFELVPSRSNGGLCLPAYSNPIANLVDNDLTNNTGFSLTGLGCTVTYSVKDITVGDTYPAGYFAGYRISSTDLVAGVTIGSKVTIETYNNNVFVESQDVVTSSIGIDASLIDGNGAAIVGFVTTGAFDEIRITYATLVGALFSGQVYYPVIESFRTPTVAMVCNSTQSLINNPEYPVIIDNLKTGITGTCAGCSINAAENIISSSTTDSATIILAASVAGTASVAVKDVLDIFPAQTFAGFNIKNPQLINANSLSGLTIRTYLNGTLVESSASNTLVSANSTLLTGSGKQLVGFVTTAPFNEVRLQVANTLGVLSTTNVFNAVFEKFCVVDALTCNTQTPMNNTGFPTTISNANTGVSGVCVGCSVTEAFNAISPSTIDYATITLTASVTGGAISVKDVLTDYPAGTFAGFNISNPQLVNVNALSGLTLRTYLDGALRETVTAGTLISVGSVLLNGIGAQLVGFQTTMSFDELQLEVTNLLGVASTTRVYNAVFEKFCPGPPLVCGATSYLTSPTYPLFIDAKLTGFNGAACVACALNNTQNLIDADTSNYAIIDLVAGVLATGSVAIKDAITDYPAGTFAGFDVENANLLRVDLLTSSTVSTYLNGVFQQSASGGTLLSLQLFGGSRQVLGFTTTLPFDEIRYTVANLVGVDAGITWVRSGVLRGGSAAGYAPPTLNAAVINGAPATNVCPDATVNLNSYVTSTTPVGSSLVWFTNATHSGSPYPTPTAATTGTYYAYYYDAVKDCYSLVTTPVNVIIRSCTRADFNVTFVNVQVSGNTHTNDNVPPGTTYGSPVAAPGNPSGSLPFVNSDGSYTFTPSAVGVYYFQIQVCAPAQAPPCPTELLVINSLFLPGQGPQPPVANPDITNVPFNTPVTVHTLANDAAGPGKSLVPGSVTVRDMNGVAAGNTAKGGTVTVDAATGDTHYTPPTGFVGTDSIEYTVCDNGIPSLCSSAYQIFYVRPPSSTFGSLGVDDFSETFADFPVSGNAVTNDGDPEKPAPTAVPQDTTIAGKGTLMLNSDGTYTFTPIPGFTGPVDFGYRVCDDMTCDSATIHILVKPFDLNPDENLTSVNVPVTGSMATNDQFPEGSTISAPTASPGNPSTDLPTLNPDGTYSFVTAVPGVYIYTVTICTPSPGSVCKNESLKITVNDPLSNTNRPMANPDQASVKGSPTSPVPVTLNLKANDLAGNTGGTLGTPSVVTGPSHGVVSSIDASGNMVYTPAAGFYGKDTVVYQVCETPGGLCTTALAIINVLPPEAPTNIAASDDNNTTKQGQPVSATAAKGVLANDNSSGGGPLAVTTQNTTVPGKGTLVLNSDGSYTFTPVSGFIGPVDFGYKVCDGIMCDSATLHINVQPGGVGLQLRVLLQGATLGNGVGFESTMRDDLRNSPFTGANYIPLKDPYTYNSQYNTLFTRVGDGTNTELQTVIDSAAMFSSRGNASAVDWIFIEMHDKTVPATVVATRSAIVERDGTVVDIDGSSCVQFPTLPPGDYFVAVRHRNHLGAMTALPVPAATLNCGGVVDFTTMTAVDLWNQPGYDGYEMKTLSDGKRALWAGNANSDKKIKYTAPNDDLFRIFTNTLQHSGNTGSDYNFDFGYGYIAGDVDMNSKVKYTAPNDDSFQVFVQLLLYGLNTGADYNYDFFLEQLP